MAITRIYTLLIVYTGNIHLYRNKNKTNIMTKEELLKQAIKSFEAIEQRAIRITTGNVSHSQAAIVNAAKRAIYFINKHINYEI